MLYPLHQIKSFHYLYLTEDKFTQSYRIVNFLKQICILRILYIKEHTLGGRGEEVICKIYIRGT